MAHVAFLLTHSRAAAAATVVPAPRKRHPRGDPPGGRRPRARGHIAAAAGSEPALPSEPATSRVDACDPFEPSPPCVALPGASNQLQALATTSRLVANTADVALVKELAAPDGGRLVRDACAHPALVLAEFCAAAMPELRLKHNDIAHQLGEGALHLKDVLEGDDEGELRTRLVQAVRSASKAGASPAAIAAALTLDLAEDLAAVLPADGRVLVPLDPMLSFDTHELINAAMGLADALERRGVDAASKLCVRMPATWEGIQACEALEKEGVQCNMTLVCSLAQGIACADAGASRVTPFVGRTLDWHRAEHARDHYPAHEDPGVLRTKRLYTLYHQEGVPSMVTPTSFRNIHEVRELAGCDSLIIPPLIMEELRACSDPLMLKLSDNYARTLWPREEVAARPLSFGRFVRLHDADACAVELLEKSVHGFAVEERHLEELVAEIMVETPTDSDEG